MKTKLLSRFPLLICLGVVFSILQSCNVAYIPNMQNVPLLQKTGNAVVNITGSDFQGAYAVTNHVGIMVNGQFKNSAWTEVDAGYKVQRSFVEGAVGLYNTAVDNKTLEIYGGTGFGSIDFKNDYLTTTGPQRYQANVYRSFIQPNIGMYGEYIDVAFSLRALKLNFANVAIQNYTEDDLKGLNIYNLDKQSFYFLEPAFTLRGGYKWVKLSIQYLHSIKINSDPMNYSNNRFLIGINIRL